MKLMDICEFIIDCEHNTAPIQDEGVPSIRTPNIGRARLILNGVNRVSEEVYEKWTKRAKPQNYDLILAREAPIGNIAIIKKSLKVCLGQRTVLIRPNKNKINPEYLLYWLLSPPMQAKILSMATGTTVAHLNMSDIRSLDLKSIPLKSIQDKIASILGNYDDLIENNFQRITILEQMAKIIYDEWFVKFKFPDYENIKIVDSEFGEIPNDWKIIGITDIEIFSFISKCVENFNGEKEYFATANIDGIQIVSKGEQVTFVSRPSRAQKQPVVYSVWFARMKDTFKVLGFSSVNKRIADSSLLSSGFAGFSSEEYVFQFLYFTINSQKFHELKDMYATGSTQVSLNNKSLSKIKILCPPLRLIEEYGEKILPLIDELFSLQLKNQNLVATRDLILPKLFSGDFDVAEFDIKVLEAEG